MSDTPGFSGCIRIRPALNAAEKEFLEDLGKPRRTLRGTPTGRGDRDVPFARMGWWVCRDGCCLRWDGDWEKATMMGPTLHFLIDHLLRPGAKAAGHPRFAAFTFDHVLDGAVMGRGSTDPETVLVAVADNVASGRTVPDVCDAVPRRHATRPRPSNVIEFRPRRA